MGEAAQTTVTALLAAAAAALRRAGIEGARLEARLLLAHALGLSPGALMGLRAEAVVAPALAGLVARRAAHEPMALILGHREFWSLEFAVSPATLIPRPDSETLIEAALAARPERGAVRRVLDLGTGTGCLLIAALHEYPAAWGVGVDRAPAAVVLARANAARLGSAGRAKFFCGNWGDALGGKFDLVLANPPYIRSAEIASLMPEVARHEPHAALDGGADGLEAYRAIIVQLPALLLPGGVAVLELGQGQDIAVAELATAAGLAVGDICRDLGGVSRAAVLCRPH